MVSDLASRTSSCSAAAPLRASAGIVAFSERGKRILFIYDDGSITRLTVSGCDGDVLSNNNISFLS